MMKPMKTEIKENDGDYFVSNSFYDLKNRFERSI